MKTTKQKRRILSVIVIAVVAALVFAYVSPFTAMAETTPAPEQPTQPTQDGQFGTDTGDLDDSTLTFPGEEEKKPARILLPNGPIPLDIDEEKIIEARLENFPEGTIPVWDTGNMSVVSVSQDGRVRGVSEGSAEIGVSAVDGEGNTIRYTVSVTVSELRPTGIAIELPADIVTLAPNSYEVKVGDVIRFSALVIPTGAKVDRFIWELGNTEVAEKTDDGRYCNFVATAVGQTQVKVSAGAFEAAISINIVESGVPLDTIWDYVKWGVIIIIAIVAIAVFVTYLSQKRKKEMARQKAIAKRRREEAERRVREEMAQEMQQEKREKLTGQNGERATMKISGAGVGAGTSMPAGQSERERPVTFDDLE